jgi:hypothetical protein
MADDDPDTSNNGQQLALLILEFLSASARNTAGSDEKEYIDIAGECL